MNGFLYMLCDSYAEDVAGYDYAVNYLVEHTEDDEYFLEYCINGMAEAIEKGFIQDCPPPLNENVQKY